ncbi:hypothetical protein [Chondromyces apiculatus]|uniref:Uncharacterized protein n=1 Tax=Chondromyces apiculatus DSM 436 TaxID=1192034 RepID=A0A017STW3_9BACT|nr:hypothetical protein [Chondromyces apiculatus]EYF00207.1 Hypothetical protein CAP_1080 [Chondromyces apiculatus DSM 436]
MREHNLNRLALIDARFGRATAVEGAEEAFDEAFLRVREAVLRPVMEDVAGELRKLGHAPRIAVEDLDHEGDPMRSCIVLHLGKRGRGEASGYVAFGVVRDGPAPEVLAWLMAPPTPFDLLRYAHPDRIDEGHVEQLLVDAIEQLFARSAG